MQVGTQDFIWTYNKVTSKREGLQFLTCLDLNSYGKPIQGSEGGWVGVSGGRRKEETEERREGREGHPEAHSAFGILSFKLS